MTIAQALDMLINNLSTVTLPVVDDKNIEKIRTAINIAEALRQSLKKTKEPEDASNAEGGEEE